MPYKVVPREDHYAVVNTESGDTVDTHDEEADAERQVRILNRMEGDEDD